MLGHSKNRSNTDSNMRYCKKRTKRATTTEKQSSRHQRCRLCRTLGSTGAKQTRTISMTILTHLVLNAKKYNFPDSWTISSAALGAGGCFFCARPERSPYDRGTHTNASGPVQPLTQESNTAVSTKVGSPKQTNTSSSMRVRICTSVLQVGEIRTFESRFEFSHLQGHL